MSYIRATLRMIYFGMGSFYYIFRYLIKATFVGDDLDRALRIRRRWFKNICWGLGVKLETYGKLPEKSGLLVSNHRSYFDPIVVLSQVLAVPVGKSEIRGWPIIGWGAQVSGTIFVKRKSKEGRKKTRQDIREMLKKGYSIMNFPEGTTHIRAQTGRFKPGMFRDAATEGFTIYPIALEYQLNADAWLGQDNFLRHFYECFGKKNTFIKVSYGKALMSNDAVQLLQDSKDWIDAELLRLRANWHASITSKSDSTKELS